jgi:hypothetical protein
MGNWCIVAVGKDGGQVVLDRSVSRDRADELRRMLLSCDIFREVRIERDHDHPDRPSCRA